MAPFAFLSGAGEAPPPHDLERMERGFQDFKQAGLAAGGEAGDTANALMGDPAGHALLSCIFANSPYLTRSLIREAGFLPRMLGQSPERLLDDLIGETEATWHDGRDRCLRDPTIFSLGTRHRATST